MLLSTALVFIFVIRRQRGKTEKRSFQYGSSMAAYQNSANTYVSPVNGSLHNLLQRSEMRHNFNGSFSVNQYMFPGSSQGYLSPDMSDASTTTTRFSQTTSKSRLISCCVSIISSLQSLCLCRDTIV